MKSVIASYDSIKYKMILSQIKEQQRIIQLEEMIDNERIKIRELEQQAKLIVKQIQLLKNTRETVDKYRGTSLPKYYPNNSPFKDRAIIRNTLLSTAYKEI